jgi:hypothetical protein
MHMHLYAHAHTQELEGQLESARCDVTLAQHEKAITIGTYEFKLEDLYVEIEVPESDSLMHILFITRRHSCIHTSVTEMWAFLMSIIDSGYSVNTSAAVGEHERYKTHHMSLCLSMYGTCRS